MDRKAAPAIFTAVPACREKSTCRLQHEHLHTSWARRIQPQSSSNTEAARGTRGTPTHLVVSGQLEVEGGGPRLGRTRPRDSGRRWCTGAARRRLWTEGRDDHSRCSTPSTSTSTSHEPKGSRGRCNGGGADRPHGVEGVAAQVRRPTATHNTRHPSTLAVNQDPSNTHSSGSWQAWL